MLKKFRVFTGLCVCVCVCMWEREGRGGERKIMRWCDDMCGWPHKKRARTEKRSEQSGLSVLLTFPDPLYHFNKQLCCHMHLCHKRSLSPGLLKTAFIPRALLLFVGWHFLNSLSVHFEWSIRSLQFLLTGESRGFFPLYFFPQQNPMTAFHSIWDAGAMDLDIFLSPFNPQIMKVWN